MAGLRLRTIPPSRSTGSIICCTPRAGSDSCSCIAGGPASHCQGGGAARGGFSTRMFTCNTNGSDLYVVDPLGKTSHFVWRDPQHIAAWAFHPSHGERFYLFQDRTRSQRDRPRRDDRQRTQHISGDWRSPLDSQRHLSWQDACSTRICTRCRPTARSRWGTSFAPGVCR